MRNVANKLGLEKDFILTLAFVFLSLVAVNYSLFPNDPGFLTIPPNPYLIAVLIAAAQFGLLSGLWAAVFTSLFVLLQGILIRPASLGAPFPPNSLLPVIVPNFLAAVVVGELQELQRRKFSRLKEHHDELDRENLRLKEQLLAVTKVKEDLEQRIIGQEATVHSLYKATKALEVLQERQVYSGILEVTHKFTGATRSSLYTIDYSQDEAVLVATRGWDDSQVVAKRIPLSNPMLRELFRRSEPLSIKDIAEDPKLEKARSEAGLQSLVLVPIVARNVVLAVLSVDEIPFLRLSLPTLRTLRMIAELASPAIANVVRFAEMEAKDQIDKLTDLHNYHYFLQALTQELRRTVRHKLPLSVVVFEIADYQSLQASLSEEALQLVIRVVGKTLQRNLREIDLVCAGRRHGTYWVMLPLTPLDHSLKVIERLRRQVRNSGKLLGLKKAKLDLLFGFATYRPYVRDAQMLIQLAEQSLELTRQSRPESDSTGPAAIQEVNTNAQ